MTLSNPSPSDIIRTALDLAHELTVADIGDPSFGDFMQRSAIEGRARSALSLLEAENSRLRGALERIRNVEYGWNKPHRLDTARGMVEDCVQMAASALARPEICPGDRAPCYVSANTDEAHWRCGTVQCPHQKTLTQPGGPARVPDTPRLDPPIAPMEIDAGRKLADWLRDRGDTNYGALVDRLVSGLVSAALAQPGDAA